MGRTGLVILDCPFSGDHTLTLDKKGHKLQWKKKLKYSRNIKVKREKGKEERGSGTDLSRSCHVSRGSRSAHMDVVYSKQRSTTHLCKSHVAFGPHTGSIVRPWVQSLMIFRAARPARRVARWWGTEVGLGNDEWSCLRGEAALDPAGT